MIKPIETIYKGYRFRSRLEARWAVFFDFLKLTWLYEPEGFFINEKTLYLPDFFLPEIEIFIEVKPRGNIHQWHDGYNYDEHFIAFEESKKQLVLLAGTPGIIEPYEESNSYEGFILGDNSYYWCQCPRCGSLGIQFDGRSARNKHKEDCPVRKPLKVELDMDGQLSDVYEDKNYNYDSDDLIKAYKKARSARFEHGEKPDA